VPSDNGEAIEKWKDLLFYRCAAVVRLLLKKRTNVFAKDNNRWIALYWAA